MKLSANFDAEAFACHDGTLVPPDLLPNLIRLVETVLQPLRDHWGGPLIEVSGYRTPPWNSRVGGAFASTHLDASGADIRPVHAHDIPRLHALALALRARGQLPGLGGLGVYPRWIHVDTRQAADGHLRRWSGTGIGGER